MIYDRPPQEDSLDQGDLLDGCPVPDLAGDPPVQPGPWNVVYDFRRVVVLTQTCDLANQKGAAVNVAEVFDAQQLIDAKLFKPADVKGPLRAGRIWGMYFLPAGADLGLGEMIVDLRRLHTVRLDLLLGLTRAGGAAGCGRRTGSTWPSTSPTHSAASACRGRMRRFDGGFRPARPTSRIPPGRPRDASVAGQFPTRPYTSPPKAP